jgi:hypothetical protein
MVATRDIGTLAASLLLEGPKGTRHVNLAGPREYSANDVAKALSTLTGKTIAVAEAPLDSMAKTLEGYGFTPDLASLYHEMTGAFLSGHVAWEAGPIVRGKTELEVLLKSILPALSRDGHPRGGEDGQPSRRCASGALHPPDELGVAVGAGNPA